MPNHPLFAGAAARALPICLLTLSLAACAAGEAENAVAEGAPVSAAEATAANQLTAEEQAAGWRLLWDGQTFNGWRGLGMDSVPSAHWTIQDGAIYKIPSGDVPVAADGQPVAGGDLMTEQAFGDYELAFEWKVSPRGNSGIKYNVSEEMSTASPPRSAALGFEYQVLDDEGHPDARAGVGGNRTSGGLYDLIAPADNKPIRPVGEWNEGRIVFRGNHGEHWLNGVKVAEYDLGTPRMDSLLAASKYAKIPGFADRRRGHIVLQDHNDAVWYRNIKIRELN
jgi:hypothetical protein